MLLATSIKAEVMDKMYTLSTSFSETTAITIYSSSLRIKTLNDSMLKELLVLSRDCKYSVSLSALRLGFPQSQISKTFACK